MNIAQFLFFVNYVKPSVHDVTLGSAVKNHTQTHCIDKSHGYFITSLTQRPVGSYNRI